MKEGVTFILAVVLLLLPPCRGEAVCFIVKAQFTTVPEQYNANIRVCAAHFTEDCFLNLGESSLQCEHYEWL